MTREKYNSILTTINQATLTEDEFKTLHIDASYKESYLSLAKILNERGGEGNALKRLNNLYIANTGEPLNAKKINYSNILVGGACE